MANLVKIKGVTLYKAFITPQEASDCAAAEQFLIAAGIPFADLYYASQDAVQCVKDSLATWSFGLDFQQYTFTTFPIVHWTEYYDDYERCVQVAKSLAELQSSSLITNKDKIVTA